MPEASQATIDSEARWRVALQVTGLLVFHHDRNLRFTWIANPALGFTAEGVLGRTDAELLGARAARTLTRIKRRVLRSGVGERQEVWVERDGQRGCFDLTVDPQRDKAGRVCGLVCAAADITERKQAQQMLADAHLSLHQLAGHMQNSLETERRAIAQDVHDHLGAALTGLHMRLSALAAAAPKNGLRAELQDLSRMVERTMRATRDICSRLHPPALDDLGLTETLRQHLREWSAHCGVRASARLGRLQPEPELVLRTDLFRIAQELLNNVARHARASQVRVTLAGGARALNLSVTDDGRGFDPALRTRGFGLAGLRERVQRHGGTLQIESGPRGSCVRVQVPRPQAR